MPSPNLRVAEGTTEADVDQVNIWMRNQPWYQSLLRGWGMDPAHPGKLSKDQRTQIMRGAQAAGVVVDEGHDEVDAYGNFDKKGHALRNTLIVAGLAAATIATMGAAGAFSAAAGPAAAAGSTAAGGAAIAPMAGALGGAAATGGAAAAGGSMIPWSLILPAVSTGIQGVVQNRQANKANELTAQQLEQQRKIQEATLSLDESKQDPYRGQMFQQRDLAHLDMMANGSYSRPVVTSPSRYAVNALKLTGGFDWSPSAALKLGAAAAQRDVAAGRGAPSVVPSQNGAPPPTRTALDLSSIYAGAPTSPASGPSPISRPAMPSGSAEDWLTELRKRRMMTAA